MLDPLEELSHYGSPVEWSAYTIVTRHPLADEGAVLRRLGMSPSDCTTCDAYWVVRGQLVLVSVEASADDPPVSTYQIKANVSGGRSFYVRTMSRPLYRSTMEAALTALKEWIDAHPTTFENLQAGGSIRVSDRDLILP
jgi:hypothetical protein